MIAIIETGGKQYKVAEGQYVDIELLDVQADDKVEIDKVLMIIDGTKSKVGQPYVEGAKIKGKIVKNDKAKKITVYKMKRKKGYRKTQGHRQPFTRLMVEKIVTSSKKAAKEEATEEQAAS